MAVSDGSPLAVWLDFAKALIWPCFLAVFIFRFRRELGRLLDRLKSFNYDKKIIEFEEQKPEPTPPQTAVSPPQQLTTLPELLSVSGFMTENSLTELVRYHARTDVDNVQLLNIFATPTQRTWLAFTDQEVFCLLDDERTRAKDSVLQWVEPKTSARPVKVYEHTSTAGRIDIGPRRSWLYSTSLFPEPTRLQFMLEAAIDH